MMGIAAMPVMFFVAGTLLPANRGLKAHIVVVRRRARRLLLPLWAYSATVALARSYGRNARDALVLMGASPLALVHVVGGGHNEAVMAALMVSALVVARRWRGYGGLGGALVLVGVATAVKLPTALAAVYLGWIGATAGPDRTSRRVVRSVLALAVVAAVIEGVAVAVSVGWGWLVDGVRSGGLVSTSMSMSLALGRALGWLVGRHGLRRRAFAQGVQTFVQALSATVAAWLVLRSPRLGLRALAVGLLVVAVLGAGVQPWYLLWSMPLFITLEAGRRARWLVVAIGVASVCTHPGGGGFFPNPGGWPILTLGLLIAGGWAAWGRRRRLVALLLG